MDPKLPLAGVRVLDMAQFLPGSLCTKILARFGAEVIKVENPLGGDNFRHYGPKVDGVGVFFQTINQGKKSITLDIKTEEDAVAIKRLMLSVDIVVENFRPGVLAQKGLGYEDICQDNPKIIYCSLTAFGQNGPRRDEPAHDLNILSIAGILELLGNNNTPPITPSVQMVGVGAALQAAIAIFAALLQARKTGEGTYIDVGLLDCVSPFALMTVAPVIAGKKEPQRGESFLGGGSACYNVYETRDGRYFSIGCIEPKYWVNFCKAIGKEDFIRDLFAPTERQREMIAVINEITKKKTLAEWVGVLDQTDTCYAPLNTLSEMLGDEQVKCRGVWDVDDSQLLPVNADFPVKFSNMGMVKGMKAPALGEHTSAILERADCSPGKE
ncbi:MAG: CoA transferase [Deltaproteobacteria bacterium]|nr:CoA transferase [Deltaproteobacteria bacterium]